MALPTASNALSLGDIESTSSLNQPFEGTISLLSTSIQEANLLRVKVAPPSVFNRVGIDRPAFLNNIRFRTTVKDGKPVIVVRSSKPINEPFLNFLLEVSWPSGKLLKEYTVLLDPPVLIQADTAIASNAAGVRQEPAVRQAPRRQAAAPARTARQQQPRKVVRTVKAAPPSKLRRPGPPLSAAARASRIKTYRVKRGDTLFKVARKLGYKGIRKEQMMMALYNKNKRAFSQSNMNNLKAGAVLSRPTYQEAKSLSSKNAKSQVVAQAKSWKQGRAGTDTKNATSRKNGTASNSTRPARVEVVGGRKSVGTNTSLGGSASGTNGELRKQLVLTNEALTTRLKENEELKSRVTELESLLRKKNKLITLKSEQLARLQEKLGNAGGTVSPIAVNTDPVINDTTLTAGTEDGTGIQQSVATEEAARAGKILRTDPDQLAIGTDNPPIVDNSQTNLDQASAADVKTASTESESLDIMGLLSSPAAMGVGGGTLMALLGGFWFMRRRKETGEYQEFGDIDIDNQLGDQEDDLNLDDSSLTAAETPFNESEFTSSDIVIENDVNANDEITKGAEQEDILQEADVYIVYGLHDQAEAELQHAIDDDPTNLAYRAKLLENHKAAGNKEAFEKEAKAFMDLEVDGKDAYLDDITEWGNTLLPESKLFDGDTLKTAAGVVTGAGVAMVAGTALANNDVEDKSTDLIDDIKDSISDDKISDIDTDLNTVDLDLDDILSEKEDAGDFLDMDDDLNIDLDTKDIKIDDIEMDVADNFNFDIDKEITDEEFDLEIDSTENLLESVDSDEIDFLDLDDDSDLDVKSISTDNLDAANLNLNLDANDFEKIMPKDNAYKKQAVDDLEEDNLLADFDDNLSFLDLDDDSEIIEETQIDTKLDLARAYIDMGDIEGARSTLEEVLLEGSDEQKKEAEDLLHQTG